MARYCPGFETDSMFEVAKAIKDRCFREDLSIFSDEKVWTKDNARSLLDLYTTRGKVVIWKKWKARLKVPRRNSAS